MLFRSRAGSPPSTGFLGALSVNIRKQFVVDAGDIAPMSGPQAKAVFAGFVYNVGKLR